MEKILSINNDKIKEIKKLRQKKYRKQKNLFIVENMHLIEEAYKHKRLKVVITDKDDFVLKGVEVIYVSINVMKSISYLQSSTNYIGIVEINEKKIDVEKDIVVLENIQDPSNLGAILRNALAFNIKNILLSNDCVDIYNEKVVQASQGALFALNIEYCDLENKISFLKNNNYFLIGTSLQNAIRLDSTILNHKKVALFFGNEGKGLSSFVLNKMDCNYKILIDNIDSLNVACASAIFFYQLSKNNF